MKIVKILGLVKVTDFGCTVRGDGLYYGALQVEIFCALKVILDAGWNYSRDIWNPKVIVGLFIKSKLDHH